jgi:hypothetical protein
VSLLICDVVVVFLLYLTESVSQSLVSLYRIISYLNKVAAAGGENEVGESVASYAIFQFCQ